MKKFLVFICFALAFSSKVIGKETTYSKELFDKAISEGKVVVVSSWIKYCSSCAGQMKVLKKAKNVIVDCEFTIEKLKRNGFYRNYFLIYDAIREIPDNPDEQITQMLTKSKNKTIILTVAALHSTKNKGHRIICNFLKQTSNNNVEYWIVGSGPDGEELERYVLKNELSNRVRFLGYQPDNNLPALYRVATVHALISKDIEGMGEGLPLTLIEAASYGTKIIYGNQDGAAELLKYQTGTTGAVDPFDNRDIYSKLNALLLGADQITDLTSFSEEAFCIKTRETILND